MPFCDACDRHWTPTSMRPDGSCPSCGQVLELRQLLPQPAAATETGSGADEEAGPKAPWHFKVLLCGLVIYLGWRGVQGLEWVAHHI